MRVIKCFVMLAAAILATDAFAVHAVDTKDSRKLDKMSVDLSLQCGYLEGESREFVYDTEEGGRKLSELIWDLKSIPMAGGALTWKIAERFRLNGGAWMGLSEGSGEMLDYDWQVDGMEWTDYSRSDVDVTDATFIDVNLAWQFVRAGDFSLDALVGIKMSTFAWEDYGGEYIYSVNGFRDEVGSFEDGEVGITYEQSFTIPYLGVMAAYHSESVDIGAYVIGSAFGTASDEDYHVLRELHFEEEFSAVPYLAAGITAVWRFAERFYVSAGVEYEQVPETTGDMYIVELDEGAEDGAGISHESLMVKAAIGVTL